VTPLLGPALPYSRCRIYLLEYPIFPRIIICICLSRILSLPHTLPPSFLLLSSSYSRSCPSHCSTKHPFPLYLLPTFLIHTPTFTSLSFLHNCYPWPPCSPLPFNQPASHLSSRGCGTCGPARYTHPNPSLDSR